ncbi:MAG: ATP-dependent helicase [Fibrobacteria bacterium]|nr:ATP-dependent helicase [Fibrobacteria bacterium]
MGLASKYLAPSRIRQQTAAPSNMLVEINKDPTEAAAKEFNAKIADALESMKPDVRKLKKIKGIITGNIDKICSEVAIEKIRPDFRSVIADSLEYSPERLFAGLEEYQSDISKITFGKNILTPIFELMKNKYKALFPRVVDFLEFVYELDEYQLAVIDSGSKVVVIIAGAGAGKTRVVYFWVRNLVVGGMQPSQILILTFSDDASKVATKRIENEFPSVEVCTFHKFAIKIIHEYCYFFPELNFHNLRVIDEEEQKSILKKIIVELEITANVDDFLLPMQQNAHIGKDPLGDVGLSEIQKTVISKYNQKKKERNGLDFNDMVYQLIKTLREQPMLRNEISMAYSAICFDEAQDCFPVFIEALSLICDYQNVLVVGDPSQRIFGFAGAADNAFKDVLDRIDGKLMVLPYNHRSASDIVITMDQFIRSNPREIYRPVIPEKEQEKRGIIFKEFHRETEQYDFLHNEISNLLKDYKKSDIAILGRTNRQLYEPLRLFGDESPIASRYNMNLKTNFQDAQQIAKNIFLLGDVWCSQHKEIGQPYQLELAELIWYTFNNGIFEDVDKIDEMVKKLPFPCVPASEFPDYADMLAPALAYRLKKVSAIFADGDFLGLLPRELENLISGNSESKSGIKRIHHEMKRIISFYYSKIKSGDPLEFINWLSKRDLNDSITCSTISRSKGNEWPVVFLLGCNENMYPHYYAKESGSMKALDDEMRLFYVGCTRAMESLYLLSNSINAKGHYVQQSRYMQKLNEIYQELSTGSAGESHE